MLYFGFKIKNYIWLNNFLQAISEYYSSNHIFSMLSKIYIFTILLLFTNASVAQKTDSIINAIKTKYRAIHASINTYDTVTHNLNDETTEGGYATGYYQKKKLKLIRTFYYGETGKSVIEYYFDAGELFFVIEKNVTYNRPVYWDKTNSKNNNDSVKFASKKNTVAEDQYYFYNEKLIRWIDSSGKQVNLKEGTNTIAGQGLIAYAYKMRGDLKK